jgi:hypothetical protein
LIIVLAIALLLLTIAMVVLYAMMGELASRLPAEEATPATWIHELVDFRDGASAAVWPEGLFPLASVTNAVLLVLSPICNTCSKVAAELGRLPEGELGDSLGLVVSAGNREVGEDFVETHSLGHIPHFVDEGGAWTTGNFDVNTSPTALMFKKGVLTEAYAFGTIEAIRPMVTKTQREGAH